ncbi:PREDICTED: bidirectional sugar transporter N3-like [Erythranthe guttata]|uniref:bidirectional sugar transporter N3-like n=1 Tax=Erythranthe guttata TaxID=4155 RepID=UPI00064D768C|nr:PREDICTED: bidirectional sugar transporter N3-like [Erythranthe guttata]|eukprot:XP_012849830.1 PREDICTED: bidirectional sugar transporter N3-like [Erythranthe guttata]
MFIKIYGEKSTVGYSVMPYTVALMSSGIWLYYGAIEKDGHLLIGVNAFGCVVETVYIIMYIVYSPPHHKIRIIRLLSILLCILCTIILFTFFMWKGNTREEIVSWICFGASISVYGATVGSVVRAIRTRSVAFMPITLTCVLTVNAIIWGVYGFLRGDAAIWPCTRGRTGHCVLGITLGATVAEPQLEMAAVDGDPLEVAAAGESELGLEVV